MTRDAETGVYFVDFEFSSYDPVQGTFRSCEASSFVLYRTDGNGNEVSSEDRFETGAYRYAFEQQADGSVKFGGYVPVGRPADGTCEPFHDPPW